MSQYEDSQNKATILMEALPYVRRFRGSVFVVKYGGSFMDSPDPAVRSQVAQDLVFLNFVGIKVVVVHGGGKAVTKELESRGFEFIAINSQLKRHPQYVCIDKNKQRYFVIVKASKITSFPITYDVIWMETFKKHAQSQQAKILFAGVGLADKKNENLPPFLNEEYLLQYDGIQFLDVELN